MNSNLRAVEHFQSQNIKVLGRSRTDDFREAAYPDPHQFTSLALLLLLLPETVVIDMVHCLLERRRVVAAVVRPAEDRLVRELFRRDKILHPEFCRIYPHFVGEDVDQSLDYVNCFGDSERTAVGDSSLGLVR